MTEPRSAIDGRTDVVALLALRVVSRHPVAPHLPLMKAGPSRTWAVRQHLVPALGVRRVRKLSADDVARLLQDKATAGYSRASLDEMRGVLVQVLRHVERQRLVLRNVAAPVPTPAGPRAEGRSLTVAQAGDLLRRREGTRARRPSWWA